MAGKRMFAKTIIDSDAFLDMPLSTQALYFHLNMRADDDGFVNNPKQIQRMIGCGDDDRKLLIAKKFVIPFESGICVIKHWRIHNYIAKDRYKPTVYEEEKNQLYLKENKAYTINNPNTKCIQNVSQDVIQNDNNVYKEENVKSDVKSVIPMCEDSCIQNVYNLDTQNRLDKNRLEKNRLEKTTTSIEDEIKEILKDDSSGSGDFNIFEYMQQRGFITISAMMAQQIQADIEIYSLEEVKQAIDIADNNGKHTYSYVQGILKRRRAGIDDRNKNKDEFKKLQERMANGEEVF